MIPALQTARASLKGDVTQRQIVDWLNAKDYKTVTGRNWRVQTLHQLMFVDQRIAEGAQKAFDRECAIERFLGRLSATLRGRLESERDARIAEGERIAREIRKLV